MLHLYHRAKDSFVRNVYQFFRAGRSAYLFLLGLLLLSLGVIVMKAAADSPEAAVADSGWPRFVATTGTNQWISGSFLISGACIVFSINYLPRLEGEA